MDNDDTNTVPRHDLTFWQRNALTIITIVIGVLFVGVIVMHVTT